MKYANTVIQQTAATAYFVECGIQLADDQNASTPAAISSRPVAPYSRITDSRLAWTSALRRDSRPGASSACPMRKPAAPERTIAVSSNAAWVTMNEKKVGDRPRLAR